MLRKIIAGLAVLVLLGPMLVLVSVGLLVNPSAASCAAPAGSVQVGNIPDELVSTTRDGEQIVLGKAELTHAATIIETGSSTEGVGRDGILIALMAALTESRMRMLANTSAYPESGDYPNDGNGSDNDSLGLFQMRPASGWGTVAELWGVTLLVDSRYQEGTTGNHVYESQDVHAGVQSRRGPVGGAGAPADRAGRA